VVAFNGDGESGASNTVSCFTLANVPKTPLLGEVGADYITVALVPDDGNPGLTEYAIYEANSQKYVQSNGSFDSAEAWLTYEQWGSAAGIKVVGGQYVAQMKMALDTGQSYNFMAKARNGDGITTTFSGGTAGTPPEGAINIVASKAVGINLAMGGMINSVIGKAVFAQWQEAGQTSQGVRLFQELSIFLNIVLLILLLIIVVSIFESFKRLTVSGFGKKLQIIKNLLLKGHLQTVVS
jgi:hypothetical protein